MSSELNAYERRCKDVSNRTSGNSCSGCDNEHDNRLFRFFVMYAWNYEENSGCLDCAAKKLVRWLDLAEMRLNDESWYLASKLDIRIRSKVELTDSVRSNQSLLREVEASNEKIICAQLAYTLRKVLALLIDGKGDVNYQNDKGQTLLHAFLEQCTKIDDNIPEDRTLDRTIKLVKSLVVNGASLYAVDKAGKMPFDVAMRCQNREIMRAIVSCLNIEDVDHEGNTALHFILENCVNDAFEHKDESTHIVRILVSRGAAVNAENHRGLTPVHLAAEKYHVELLKFFAEHDKANFHRRTKDEKTPLHFACASTLKPKDSTKIMQTFDFLMSKDCALEAADEEGYTPLHFAAEFRRVEIVEMLIALGVDVDCRTKPLLITPLYLAAKRDRLQIMKALLKAGADVNAEAVDGSTPIFMSVMWGSLESMRFLIDRGADVHRRERYRGVTLLHLAARDRFQSQIKSADSSESLDEGIEAETKFHVLVEMGFDVNDQGYCGVTPLHLAVLSQNTDFVRILVERGADANLQSDIVEWTAMHIAALKKSVHTLKFLIEKGYDVNCRSSVDRATPLHLASIRHMSWGLGRDFENTIDRHLSLLVKFWRDVPIVQELPEKEVVVLLIDNRADVNARDIARKSPLHWATLRPRVDLIARLLDAGARVNVQDNEGKLPLHNVLTSGNAEAFELLLEFGADINDDDTSEQIVSGKSALRNLAVKHSIKLKLVGLPIARVYEAFVRSSEFEDFYEGCSNEARALVDQRDGDFSLYRFLRMGSRRQYHFAEKILNSYENLEDDFPFYASVIRAACTEAINRRPILEKAKVAWYEICDVSLPDLCVDKILSCLNNRYLESLAVSVENDDKVKIVKKYKSALKGRT